MSSTNQVNTDEESESLYGNSTPRNFDAGLDEKTKLTPALFEEFQNSIFNSRPDIKEFIANFGSRSFFDYSKSHIRENRNPIIKTRKKELHDVIYTETRNLLGSKIAQSVIRQLKGNDSVSTIQHTVPLGHPYILSATFQSALPYLGATHPNLQNVIVMANSLASFNNYSFPKADLLHLFNKDKLESQQFSFFGQTSEASPTIFHDPFTTNEIEEITKKILQLRQNGKITKENLANLLELLNDIYSNPHVLSQKNYCDQLTVLNYYLFNKLLKGYNDHIPNLVFLSQEQITLQLIAKYHLNKETLLGKLILNPKYHKTFIDNFDGLNGAFNSKKGTGTHLFWAMPKGAKYRERLELYKGCLKSQDSSYQLTLDPEAVHKAILNNELIPSTSLVFIALSFYYGLFLGGGLAQVNNLGALKNAYISFLASLKETTEISAMDQIITSNMLVSRPTMLYMQKSEIRIPLTGMDLIIYSKDKLNWDQVIKSAKTVTLEDILSRIYPFYYSQFSGDENQTFSSITEKDIEKFKDLSKKIPSLFEV